MERLDVNAGDSPDGVGFINNLVDAACRLEIQLRSRKRVTQLERELIAAVCLARAHGAIIETVIQDGDSAKVQEQVAATAEDTHPAPAPVLKRRCKGCGCSLHEKTTNEYCANCGDTCGVCHKFVPKWLTLQLQEGRICLECIPAIPEGPVAGDRGETNKAPQ